MLRETNIYTKLTSMQNMKIHKFGKHKQINAQVRIDNIYDIYKTQKQRNYRNVIH